MAFSNAISSGVHLSATISGRASRPDYWRLELLNSLFAFFVIFPAFGRFLLHFLSASINRMTTPSPLALTFALAIFSVLSIPLFFVAKASQTGTNKYGPNLSEVST